MEAQIQAYTTKKNSIKEFKDSLEKYVAESTDDRPVVFIIDEMDRCRPNYAVELLEQIKHLFNVKGIVFVLSIDKVQLGHAIRGVYGNDNINSDEYLRRFIDVEYSLPRPEKMAFINYLYGFFRFDEFFSKGERNRYRDFESDGRRFLEFSEVLFNENPLTLRQQEKILSHTRLALNSFKANQYVFPGLFLFLIYLKHHYVAIYNEIQKFEQSFQEILNMIEKPFLNVVGRKELETFLYIEAQFISFYHNSVEKKFNYTTNLIIKDDSGNEKLNVKTSHQSEDANELLFNFVQHIIRSIDMHGLKLEFLLNRINLTEPIVAK